MERLPRVWEARFHELASTVASWSKDPDRKVGAVLISPDKRQVSYGYNGFPAGLPDNYNITNEAKQHITVHAELNAILNCPVRPVGWMLFCTSCPCHECAKAIVQAGITAVYAPAPTPDEASKWYASQRVGSVIFEAGVQTFYWET